MEQLDDDEIPQGDRPLKVLQLLQYALQHGSTEGAPFFNSDRWLDYYT